MPGGRINVRSQLQDPFEAFKPPREIQHLLQNPPPPDWMRDMHRKEDGPSPVGEGPYPYVDIR